MSALILRNHSHNNITIVENDFIDHYMVSANGEYVKVYLLLLRYQNIPEQLPDIPQTFWRIPKAISCAHSNTGKKKEFFLSNMTKQMNSPESVSEKHQLIRHLSKQLSIHLPHSLLPFMKNLRSRSLMEIPLFQTKLPVRIFLHQGVPLLQEEN